MSELKQPVSFHLQNGHDDAEEADGAAEDLHDEDLHEEAAVLGVRQRRAAAHDADADAAEEVGEADGQTGSKHGVTWRDGKTKRVTRERERERPPACDRCNVRQQKSNFL